MFSVIFEVDRKPERSDEYLALAKHLKPLLEKIDGFIDNERFESKRRPGCLLSHSTWRDEKSVVRWRTEGEHHGVQEKGRFDIFRDYHLRVGEVVADTAASADDPLRQYRFDETETAPAKFATFTEVEPRAQTSVAFAVDALAGRLGLDQHAPGLIAHDIFESIYSPGKLAVVGAWKNAESAQSWVPNAVEGARSLRHRVIRVIRDYGMFDRREAPQFYKAAE